MKKKNMHQGYFQEDNHVCNLFCNQVKNALKAHRLGNTREIFISIFSFSSHHTCIPAASHSWHKEQRWWVHGHCLGKCAQTVGWFDHVLNRSSTGEEGRGNCFSHSAHSRQDTFLTILSQNCDSTTLAWKNENK